MDEHISKIFEKHLNESPLGITEIKGFGIVNKVYEVNTKQKDYVIRLNENLNKYEEYEKEKWCLEQARKLGIPSPEVIKVGKLNKLIFIIQNKLEGKNGSLVESSHRNKLWQTLGLYASKFHNIKVAGNIKVFQNEFHKNWYAKLHYNIEQLSPADPLLLLPQIDNIKHKRIKLSLESLKSKKLNPSLIHGDLGLKNVVFDGKTTFLLDWGTAETGITPHSEIASVLCWKIISKADFNAFLNGLGLDESKYVVLKSEIFAVNLLDRLDKYRWAYDYDRENIEQYEDKIMWAFNLLNEGN